MIQRNERILGKIVVISEDLRVPWDEGIKKFAWSVGNALGRRHEVKIVNVDRAGENGSVETGSPERVPGTRTFATPALRGAIRDFGPDTVIYVPSPSSTISSFARCFFLRRHAPSANLCMVALIPRRHPPVLRPVLAGTAPDIVFVPSRKSQLHLREMSIRGELTPIGVDTGLFRPPEPGEREKLRRDHGIDGNRYLFLHVGHLSAKRNLTRLIRLTKMRDSQVIVVGSTSTPEDESLRKTLESSGITVIRRHVPVEQFYRMADCYVFPVEDHEGCVEIPLSVFEALASGLPVLSTVFGGLRDFLQPGDDLNYFRPDEDLPALAAAVREAGPTGVRSMESFRWENVADRIVRKLTEKKDRG
jgi:glycosyltransferase involved in cell wall biosynthesis